jgi:hypothetical protein
MYKKKEQYYDRKNKREKEKQTKEETTIQRDAKTYSAEEIRRTQVGYRSKPAIP